MQPLVSLIIPCYDKAQHLRETLDSVATQTYPSIEVVVVDDDSPRQHKRGGAGMAKKTKRVSNRKEILIET